MQRQPNIATSESGFGFSFATNDSFASPLAAGTLTLLRAGEPESALVTSLLGRYDVPKTQLGRDSTGVPRPAALLHLARGEAVAPFGPVAAGKLFVRYT